MGALQFTPSFRLPRGKGPRTKKQARKAQERRVAEALVQRGLRGARRW